MEEKISINDAFLKYGQNSLIVTRKKGFGVLNDINSQDSFMNVKSIIKHVNSKISLGLDEKRIILNNLSQEENILSPLTGVVDNTPLKDLVQITSDDVTVIVSLELLNENNENKNISSVYKSEYHSIKSIKIILFIDKDLSQKNLLKLYKIAVEAKSLALWDLDVRDKFYELLTGLDEDVILIACKGFKEDNHEKMGTELQNHVKKIIREALIKALHNYKYPKNIFDFINRVGVSIDELVEAGMELCVGVEITDEIYQTLKEQIIKSLTDINVITLVMAGIRVEEDYAKHRLKEVDVDDDPAYLYTDEVLGMAIANQIAGTKAIFNFKRYDEEKPGILSELGPMLDDIFAGIIAGCMSKIFEE
ncbi:MAG: phosphatidylglycerophosphatase A [Methanomicrobiales archaeon]